MRYRHEQVVEYALRLNRAAKGLSYDFLVVMREQFPGITDRALSKALDDAKMIVALEIVMTKERGDQ